ncbi:MAG: hypothetical protein LIP02_00915 [Bacteroidales bacterium]|nr:hypothetical protein [Bacteroidales bacterium]
MSRSSLALALLLIITSFSARADRWSWLLLEDCVEIGATDGYKGQRVREWRKGYGMQRLEGGSFYVGLFQDDHATGSGIIVAPGIQFLANCDSTAYYVGKVVDGVPQGAGKCYNDYGKLIYKGAFDQGRPVDPYPSATIDDPHRFVNIDLDEGMYLFCEATDTVLDGLSYMVGTDRSLWVGRFKNNDISGLTMNCTPLGDWQTAYVRDGQAQVQSSATEYAMYDAMQQVALENALALMEEQQRQAQAAYDLEHAEQRARGSRWERFLNGFINACQIIGDVANTAGNLINTYESIKSGAYADGGAMGAGGGGSYQEQYDRWARLAERHYNSLTNVGTRVKQGGKDVGGTTGQSLNTGNYTSQKSSLREAQREMKSIRQKARRAGVNIRKSEYEDIVVKY